MYSRDDLLYITLMADLKLLLRTTPKYVSLLAQNGIVTVQDFLQYFPRAYEDRSNLKTLNEINQDSMFFKNEKNEKVMVKCQIVKKSVFYRGGKKIYDIQFADELGNK
ncbi:hypothetical protein KKG31_06870 [Patescibacteria group bacterium]|nr:hypothetical protein [Patescibacteria group bacterium]MBU1758809.1 hypothetical protein [Patescibacteria group bacterium]